MIGHDLEVLGIEVVMGIPQGVDVTRGPADPGRGFLEHVDAFRGVHEPLGAGLDLRVSAPGKDQRQPATVELQADRHEHVGVLDGLHQAGFCRNEVRILVASAETLRCHVLSADELSDGGEVRQRRGDLEVGECGYGRQCAEPQGQRESNQ